MKREPIDVTISISRPQELMDLLRNGKIEITPYWEWFKKYNKSADYFTYIYHKYPEYQEDCYKGILKYGDCRTLYFFANAFPQYAEEILPLILSKPTDKTYYETLCYWTYTQLPHKDKVEKAIAIYKTMKGL